VVKGKTLGEKIFTARKSLDNGFKEGWALHHKALKLYYRKDFKGAENLFKKVQEHIPGDYLSEMFLERCKNYIKNPPPPDWVGLEVLKEK